MNRQHTLFTLAATLVMSLLVLAMPAAAQEDGFSITVTEAEVNDALRFENRYLVRFGPSSVDLQPGQMVVSGTYIAVNADEDIPFTVTLAPAIVDSDAMPGNGNVVWDITAMTINEESVSQETIDQISQWVSRSIRRIIRENVVAGDVEAVTVTDNDITYFYSGDNRPYGSSR